MVMVTTTESTPIATSTHSKEHVFRVDDMDFSSYDNAQLAYLCDHRVFVRSRFPKLVFTLVHHPRFVEWIESTPDVTCASEADKVACVVDAVCAYAVNSSGKLTHPTISLSDPTFWQVLVEQCWQHKGVDNAQGAAALSNNTNVASASAVADHERQVLHRVQRTLKPYRYWKGSAEHITVQRGSSDGKRAGTNTTRKKTRSIWID